MFDNLYSRIVAWLKILLPLVALGILSTVFIFARAPDVERAIPYAPVTEDFTGDERISEPKFVGMTTDGSAISIDSEFIRPDLEDADVMESGAFVAQIESQSGRIIDMRSDVGSVDVPASLATFAGSVRVATSNGYELLTDELSSRLDQTLIESPGAIQGTGPIGEINAGSMRISADANAGYVLDFNGGVQLLYQP